MNSFEVFQKDGEVKFLFEFDAQALAHELIWKEIPFCVVYDPTHTIVRSIDWVVDGLEK